MRGLLPVRSRGGDRRPRTTLLKRVLLSLLVVGLLGTVTAKRVSAVFLTENVNTGNSVSTATFTFDTTVGNQAACSSEGLVTDTPTNNQEVCAGNTGMLFSGLPLRYPGDQTSVNVKVKNTGSVDAQDIQVGMDSCVPSTTPSVPLQGTEGTGNPCGSGGLELYIQETDASGNNLTNGCLYPDPHATPYSPPDMPGTGSTTDCTTIWTADTLDNLANVISCWDLGRLAAGATRYFKIGVQFPANSDNTFQGTTATFDLNWHLDSVDGAYTPASCANDF